MLKLMIQLKVFFVLNNNSGHVFILYNDFTYYNTYIHYKILKQKMCSLDHYVLIVKRQSL